MSDKDELLDLDYVAYDHVEELEEDLKDRRIRRPDIYMGFHFEEDTPVVDVAAHGDDQSFIDSYHLEGMPEEVFEDLGYETWTYTFKNCFDNVTSIGDHL